MTLFMVAGFADSSGYPTEHGAVNDSFSVYSYIRSQASHVPIYIWGHSLGTSYVVWYHDL